MTTTTTYHPNVLQPNWSGTTIAYHDTIDVTGQKHTATMVETRDKTLVFIDNNQFLNFATGDRSTIDYRFNTNISFVSDGNYTNLLMDTQDNVLIFSIIYQSNSPGIYCYRYTKPTEGWKTWSTNASRAALTRTTLISNYRVQTNTNYPAAWMNTVGVHVCRAANIANGVLYVATVGNNYGGNTGSYTNHIGYSFNLTSGSVITTGVNTSSKNEPATNGNTSNQWVHDPVPNGGGGSQQFVPFGSSGYFWRTHCTNATNPSQSNIFNATTTSAGRFTFYYHRWSIDANGNLTANAEGYGDNTASFKNMNDVEASSGNISTFSYSSTFAPASAPPGFSGYTENVLFCRIRSGKPTLQWAYNNNTGTVESYTYSSLPTNFVFTAGCAPTIVWIPQTNTVRMYASNNTTSCYMDITWNGTTFTFPASATVLSSVATNKPFMVTQTPMLDLADVWKNTTLNSVTSGVSTSYTYSTNGSIPEPYVSTLKANNGIKFVHQAAAVSSTANTAAFGSDLNFADKFETFQFTRTAGGVTEYYNYTTNAFTSSVVNNVTTLYPTNGSIPASSTSSFVHDLAGSWNDNTSYTYQIIYKDSSNIVSNSSTTTIATPAVSAAPASPTPRRLFVFPLQAKTSSHILSIENRVLINKIHIVNTSASSATVSLNLGGFNILSTQTVAANQTLQINTAITAAVAERLLATCSANSAITLWLMGTEGV